SKLFKRFFGLAVVVAICLCSQCRCSAIANADVLYNADDIKSKLDGLDSESQKAMARFAVGLRGMPDEQQADLFARMVTKADESDNKSSSSLINQAADLLEERQEEVGRAKAATEATMRLANTESEVERTEKELAKIDNEFLEDGNRLKRKERLLKVFSDEGGTEKNQEVASLKAEIAELKNKLEDVVRVNQIDDLGKQLKEARERKMWADEVINKIGPTENETGTIKVLEAELDRITGAAKRVRWADGVNDARPDDGPKRIGRAQRISPEIIARDEAFARRYVQNADEVSARMRGPRKNIEPVVERVPINIDISSHPLMQQKAERPKGFFGRMKAGAFNLKNNAVGRVNRWFGRGKK
ncbi:hypothetical protein HOD08_02340, partial [bacterium]|nr:hypothetical protein [bacterium]